MSQDIHVVGMDNDLLSRWSTVAVDQRLQSVKSDKAFNYRKNLQLSNADCKVKQYKVAKLMRNQRIHSDLFTRQFRETPYSHLISPHLTSPHPRWACIRCASSPVSYLMHFFEKKTVSVFCESPNGSSYIYSANGHRFESYHNPFD